MADVQNNQSLSNEASSQRRLSLWRNRDYLLLWGGQMVSLTGTGISQLAFPLLVLFLTGSPAQAGFAGALRSLPYLFLSLPAGALVDRWNRKKMMISCDIGRALTLVSIPFAFAIGHLTVFQLYVTSLLEGTFFVFFNLAETANLRHVVDKEQLATAAAQNEATYNFTFLVSPLLGGVLYTAGRVLPFLADALSYILSSCSLLLIRSSLQKERTTPSSKLYKEILEGLSWLRHQPLICYIALLTGCINLIFPCSELIVIVIAQQQHASPAFIGVIFAVGGVGSTLGALLSAPVQKKFRFGTTIIGVCWLMALIWPLLAIAPNSFMVAAAFAGIVLVGPIYNVTQYSYRIVLIPDELQGRVNSVSRLISFCLQPLGLALTGVLLQRLGAQLTVLVFFAILVVLAIATSLNSHVRHALPLAEINAL